MNAEQLNSIKERAAKATVGPWKLDTYDMTIRSTNDKHTVVCVPTFNTYDSELIASSREDIPALVAEVERLRAELEDIIAVATEEAACLSYESGYEDIVKIANDALK